MSKREPRIEDTVLTLLRDTEKAAIFDEMVAANANIRSTAENAALLRMASVDAKEIADIVVKSLTQLKQDELTGREGKTPYGYVEPNEAAWTLLEREVEPWIEDVARRSSLGLPKAALRLAIGIIDGLYRAEEYANDHDLLLAWALDFPSETADQVLRLLDDIGIDLPQAELARVAPDWL